MIPVDDDGPSVAEAKVVTPDVEVDERPGQRRGGGRRDEGRESPLEPGARAEAERKEWRGMGGDRLPVDARVASCARWSGGGVPDRRQRVEDSSDPLVGPGWRPVGGRQILQGENRPRAIVVEAEDFREEPAA